MKVILLACLCFAAALALPDKSQLRPTIRMRDENNLFIVGGNNAVPNAHRYQVSLQAPVSGGWAHFCGGSIISQNKVVTAAHCIDTGMYIPSLRVVAGDHDLYQVEGTEQASMWASAVFHPNYDYTTIDWDYGVITLATNFTFNQYVQPVFLAEEGTEPTGTCTATGWGYTSPAGNPPSILQKVDLPFVPRANCSSIYSSINWAITERMLCAGGEAKKSVCDGDSGGALVCQGLRGDYLAGIASYVMPQCGENAFPDGFANVAFGRSWLLSN
jgi:secreted trypsin-like serine protease